MLYFKGYVRIIYQYTKRPRVHAEVPEQYHNQQNSPIIRNLSCNILVKDLPHNGNFWPPRGSLHACSSYAYLRLKENEKVNLGFRLIFVRRT